MKRMQRKALAVALALICAISYENSVYSQSKEATVIEQADVDNPDLKLTLEIYPTEVYFGDVVFFATYYNNVSNKTIDKCLDFNDYPSFITYSNSVTITSPQLEHEYLWRPENTSGAIPSMAKRYVSIPKNEKRLIGMTDVELPPLEDWNDPFWKELREKMTPDGIVCQFQVAQRYEIRSVKRKVVFSQDILIKPRPEEETALLEKWFNNTPQNLFPEGNGSERLSNIHSFGRDDGGFIVVDGKEYNPKHFVRTVTFKKPFIPNNPTTLEGWRELDSKFCDSTLHDEIKYARLLLEYLAAEEGEATKQTKKELTDWIDSLPMFQRQFFFNSLVKESFWFYDGTPFAQKSRRLMDYFHIELTTPKTRSPRHKHTESMEPTQEEIVNGSRTLQDGYRIWIYNGPIFTETLAAKIVQFKGPNRVTIQYRDLRMEDLNIDQFSKEDQKYIQEMKDKNPSGGLLNSAGKH